MNTTRTERRAYREFRFAVDGRTDRHGRSTAARHDQHEEDRQVLSDGVQLSMEGRALLEVAVDREARVGDDLDDGLVQAVGRAVARNPDLVRADLGQAADHGAARLGGDVAGVGRQLVGDHLPQRDRLREPPRQRPKNSRCHPSLVRRGCLSFSSNGGG